VSRFKLRSYDFQRSRNNTFSVIAWPDATLELTGRALESGHDEFMLLNTSIGHTVELIGRGTPGVRFEYRKGPESDFIDWTRPGVRSILPFAQRLSLQAKYYKHAYEAHVCH
jgi:hypothetical protein